MYLQTAPAITHPVTPARNQAHRYLCWEKMIQMHFIRPNLVDTSSCFSSDLTLQVECLVSTRSTSAKRSSEPMLLLLSSSAWSPTASAATESFCAPTRR